MKETKRKKLENAIGDEATNMLNNTSCLAIGNIFIRNHPLLKSLWCIAFIICTILTIRQLYSLSNSYFSYPLNTVIRLQNEPVQFPSITFCNLNPFRYSQINLSKPGLQNFFSYLENKKFVNDKNNEIVSRMSDEIVFTRLVLNETSENRFRMGHQIEDFILQCSFLGEKCNTDKIFTTILSNKYGNCYTFNPYRVFNHSYIIGKRSRSEGLFITFYLQNQEYLKNFIRSSGIRIQIHEPNTLVIPEAYGSNLPPGFEISLGIVPTKIRRLVNIFGNCEEGKDFTVKYQSAYTREACLYVCIQEIIHQQCQCYDATFRLYKTIMEFEICDTDQKINCSLSIMFNSNKYNHKCKCNIGCHTTSYMIRQSFSEWPASTYEKRFIDDLRDIYPKFNMHINGDNLINARQNLTNVIIYMEDLSYQEIHQIRAYNWDNFLSDIGGTLSLYLGFSVLTGFEFFEAISLIITYFCSKFFCDKNDPTD